MTLAGKAKVLGVTRQGVFLLMTPDPASIEFLSPPEKAKYLPHIAAGDEIQIVICKAEEKNASK